MRSTRPPRHHAPVTDGWPDRLVPRPLTARDARQIAEWRYDGPWQAYDSRSDDPPVASEAGYRAVAGEDGRLVGYYCTGAEARVPGLAEQQGVLDVGVGMAPEWVGRGHGTAFAEAVLADVADGRRLRAVVQSWNRRSLRLLDRLGFVHAGRHTCVQDGREVEYAVLERSGR